MNAFFRIGLIISLFVNAIAAHQTLAQSGHKLPDSISKHSPSYLALGDSYTIGESVDPTKRFPNQTVQILASKGVFIGNPIYLAKTGWTSLDLLDALKRKPLDGKYDIISLLIGVNDQYQGLDTAGYREQFSILLGEAIQLAGSEPKHVFVLSIPDYSVTPFGKNSPIIHQEIIEFNRINQAISKDYQVNYINITPISQSALSVTQFTAIDGLHPSGEQYREWAKLLVSSIEKNLFR